MARRSAPGTCLSSHPHHGRIADARLHYFGCLKDQERQPFFDGLPEHSQRRIRAEEFRIEQARARLEFTPDSKTGTLLREFKDSVLEWRHLHGRRECKTLVTSTKKAIHEDSVDAEIKAPMIFFKNSRPYNIPGVANEFPHQKISIKKLLADEKDQSPLMQPCEENMVRYFHLPANNMIWVEEAVARYYHEKRATSGGYSFKSKHETRTKTEMLLRPEFWYGQQHYNDKSEVHARHMRPFCDGISIDPISAEPVPKNLVLFMPYLHWETDRGRMMSSNMIREASKVMFSSMGEVVEKITANEATSRNDSISAGLHSQFLNPSQQMVLLPSPAQRRKALGRLLLGAANLLEALDFVTEEKLLYEYLHKHPPLHPRRTLDQSHYGALKNTETRDRDQVVYRATSPAGHVCDEDSVGIQTAEGCKQCRDDIRMVPRLIMVDQLWLWILDENTIITSFPRRWSKNRSDPSAVHKRLRARLQFTRKGEIRSAFDLALIIIDECSRVFFDRTLSNNRQPNLIDIFAEAIKGVAYKQTAAFDQFLIYTHLAAKEHNSRNYSGTSATQNTLLNINPEGNLLKEIKDILDELHIITRLELQQQTVAESFVKQIKNSLLPKLKAIRNPTIDFYGGDSALTESLESAKWTLSCADHLLRDIQDRIFEVKSLEDAAGKTSAALKDLLTLKQQQASVVEARESVKQAAETLKQGRSIMLFTVVTIVFLPLSFCATIFGMNTAEFNNGILSLSEEFTYMFPISVGIICMSFVIAFSSNSLVSALCSLIWATITFPFNMATTWILVKTGMYTFARKATARATALKEKERKSTGLMKTNALRDKVEFKEMKEIWKEDVASSEDNSPDPDLSDVERAQSSRSQSFLFRSPRVQ